MVVGETNGSTKTAFNFTNEKYCEAGEKIKR